MCNGFESIGSCSPLIDFHGLVIDNLASSIMWVTTVCRGGGIDYIESLSKARSGDGGIRE